MPAEKPIDFATTKDDHVEVTCEGSVRKIVGFPDKAFPHSQLSIQKHSLLMGSSAVCSS